MASFDPTSIRVCVDRIHPRDLDALDRAEQLRIDADRDDLVKGGDGFVELVGAFWRLTVGLDRDHQILILDPYIERAIAET